MFGCVYIQIKKIPENYFSYLFISLYAFIKEFDYCRPIVDVDDSYLRRAYTSAFVTASILDGAVNCDT